MEIVRINVACYCDTWYPWMKPLLTAHLVRYEQGDPTPVKYVKELYCKDETNGGVFFLAGLLPFILEKAESLKISVNYKDVRDINPAVYEPRWDVVPETLRYKQEDALKLLSTKDKGVILCSTGFGKSFLIKQLVCIFPNATFTIFTKAAAVIETLYKDISGLLGKAQVGMLKAGTGPLEESKRVQISTNKSLMRSHIKTCDFIIADEVHNIGDNQVAHMLMNDVGHARMFGLTASLHRGDKGLKIIEALFGQVIMEVNYDEASHNGMVTPITAVMIKYACPVIQSIGNKALDDRRFYWQNKTRNKVIADVCSFIPADEQLLIMVNTLEHAIELHKLLPDYTVIHGGGATTRGVKTLVPWDADDAPRELTVVRKKKGDILKLELKSFIEGVYIYVDAKNNTYSFDYVHKNCLQVNGDPCGKIATVYKKMAGVSLDKYALSGKQKKELIERFEKGELKRVICTKILSEGVNIAQLKHFVRANGSASKVDSVQMTGRLSRLFQGKKQGFLYDFYDAFNPVAKAASETRLKEYKEQKWLKE